MLSIEMLTLLRFTSGLVMLSFASYADLKTRTVSNKVWLLMGGLGILLLVVQYFTIGFEMVQLVGIPIMILLAYLLFKVGIIFGGADAKALMALSFLVPFWPELNEFFPLCRSILPFPWVIFSNSIILFVFIPFILLFINAYRRDLEFPYCLVGYKMTIDDAKRGFFWPLERIKENGRRGFVWNPMDDEIENEFDKLEKIGKKEIWVTPKIPFMIPLLIGFILSFTLGDLLYTIISTLV